MSVLLGHMNIDPTMLLHSCLYIETMRTEAENLSYDRLSFLETEHSKLRDE